MPWIPTRAARLMASPEKICYARESNPGYPGMFSTFIDPQGRQKQVSQSWNAGNILIGEKSGRNRSVKTARLSIVGFFIINFVYRRGALT